MSRIKIICANDFSLEGDWYINEEIMDLMNKLMTIKHPLYSSISSKCECAVSSHEQDEKIDTVVTSCELVSVIWEINEAKAVVEDFLKTMHNNVVVDVIDVTIPIYDNGKDFCFDRTIYTNKSRLCDNVCISDYDIIDSNENERPLEYFFAKEHLSQQHILRDTQPELEIKINEKYDLEKYPPLPTDE